MSSENSDSYDSDSYDSDSYDNDSYDNDSYDNDNSYDSDNSAEYDNDNSDSDNSYDSYDSDNSDSDNSYDSDNSAEDDGECTYHPCFFVYVTNLPADIDEDEIQGLFSEYGQIQNIELDPTRAIIEYAGKNRNSDKIIRELDGSEIRGMKIKVSLEKFDLIDTVITEPGYVIVRGIHPDTTGYEIQQVLSHAGSIDSVTINRESNKDYAIVKYQNKDSVPYAVKYNNKIIHGTKVEIAIPTRKDMMNIEPGYVVVRGIPPKTTEFEIRDLFEPVGGIVSITIYETYAIVKFSDKDLIPHALQVRPFLYHADENKHITGIKIQIAIPTGNEMIPDANKRSKVVNISKIHQIITDIGVKEAIFELETRNFIDQVDIISQLVSKIQLNDAIELLKHVYRLIKKEKYRIDEVKLECFDLIKHGQSSQIIGNCTQRINQFLLDKNDSFHILSNFLDTNISNPGILRGALLYLAGYTGINKFFGFAQDIFYEDELYTYLKFNHIVYNKRYMFIPNIHELSDIHHVYSEPAELEANFISYIHKLIMNYGPSTFYQNDTYITTRDIIDRFSSFPARISFEPHVKSILSHYYYLYDLARFHKHYKLTFPEMLERISRDINSMKMYYLQLYYFIYVAIIGRLILEDIGTKTKLYGNELFRNITEIRKFFDISRAHGRKGIKLNKPKPLDITTISLNNRKHATRVYRRNSVLYFPADAIDKLFIIYRKFDEMMRSETE